MDAKRELIDVGLLATEIVDADLGIRHSAAIARADVGLVLDEPITTSRATSHCCSQILLLFFFSAAWLFLLLRFEKKNQKKKESENRNSSGFFSCLGLTLTNLDGAVLDRQYAFNSPAFISF